MAKKVKSISLSVVIAFAAFAFFPLSSVVKRDARSGQTQNPADPFVEVQDGDRAQELVLINNLTVQTVNNQILSNRYSTAVELPVVVENKREEIHAMKTQEIATDRR